MEDRKPEGALIKGVDLLVTRFDQDFSVLYGRCHHRGALLADRYVSGNNLICGLHGWNYRLDTDVSEYNNEESLYKFPAYLKKITSVF